MKKNPAHIYVNLSVVLWSNTQPLQLERKIVTVLFRLSASFENMAFCKNTFKAVFLEEVKSRHCGMFASRKSMINAVKTSKTWDRRSSWQPCVVGFWSDTFAFFLQINHTLESACKPGFGTLGSGRCPFSLFVYRCGVSDSCDASVVLNRTRLKLISLPVCCKTSLALKTCTTIERADAGM